MRLGTVPSEGRQRARNPEDVGCGRGQQPVCPEGQEMGTVWSLSRGADGPFTPGGGSGRQRRRREAEAGGPGVGVVALWPPGCSRGVWGWVWGVLVAVQWQGTEGGGHDPAELRSGERRERGLRLGQEQAGGRRRGPLAAWARVGWQLGLGAGTH